MADEIAPTTISTESPVVTEPPLASVSSSVAAKLEAELENQPPVAPPVTVMEKDVPLSVAPPHPEHPEEKVSIDTAEAQQSKPPDMKRASQSFGSFKEESNKVSDLSGSERKALDELKSLVAAAISENTLTTRISSKQLETPPAEVAEPAEKSEITAREAGNNGSADGVAIWGIPLMKDERTDVILLKFLRARDFEVKEAFGMLKNTLIWRKEYNVDALIDEELGDDLEKVVFMHGHDKEGHPVCYNLYGEFQNKELYKKTFGDVQKRASFLRWRIQFLEKSIRRLDFRPGGISTIFQVSDLKNSPGPGKRELRIATRQALHLLQDNYPEFVAKQVFINVPWWYLAFYTMMNPFMTQRTKSKFVFAGPSKTAVTLFKYISPEQVPIQYGGLSTDFCECNPEFTVHDPATEIMVKPATKQTVEIIIHEKCVIVWELRVLGWDVSYSAEYMPNTKGSYSVIIQKPKKIASTDEQLVSDRFRVAELGKLLLTIDNPTTKKKQIVYRFKVEPLDQ